MYCSCQIQYLTGFVDLITFNLCQRLPLNHFSLFRCYLSPFTPHLRPPPIWSNAKITCEGRQMIFLSDKFIFSGVKMAFWHENQKKSIFLFNFYRLLFKG